ncbi:hypothetical protein [Shouchella clausii]|uniref:hypothetical protein n=1 Tax=Shouchella clausii TaxID=79880 RepID=UPI0015CAD941|nr:hypothetical protein [Shouchella clausii]
MRHSVIKQRQAMVLFKWMWAMQTDAAFVGIDKALHLPLGRKMAGGTLPCYRSAHCNDF